MMKKKRYKFHVDISELELSEVSYSKAILFAKVRQLDGGNFSDVSKRMEVQNHRVQYNARFQVFNSCTYLPYARYYKPLLVYFLTNFWRPFLCFQSVNSENSVFM